VLFIVLCPDESTVQNGWAGVSYQSYCRALRRRLDDFFPADRDSKWLVFARELILHLQLELYSAEMTPEEFESADKFHTDLARARDLYVKIREHLRVRLACLLEEEIPGETFAAGDHGWAIRCSGSSWGRSDMAFEYIDTPSDMRLQLTVYLYDLTAEQTILAQSELRDRLRMKYSPGGRWGMWRSSEPLPDRAAAEAEWKRLGHFVSGLYRQL
jgi:hypothetical protein